MRYTLTNPKIKGAKTDYFEWLEAVNRMTISMNYAKKANSYMTFQALRSRGLLSYSVQEHVYSVTEKGGFYIRYVNSTNKPKKHILEAILG